MARDNSGYGGNQPAAVINDTNMPKLNGVQLLERVKSARPDLPVIVLFSGLGGSTITADDIMARGAHLVLSKTDALVHVLQNLTDLLKIDS
ncbi:MAG: response regulator [Bdellovibrionales bacterium]|nr:response regulator [Bdellovibrionales bacterium]